jgi:hypothetical protein
MMTALFDDDSDEENMPDLVGSDNESDDGYQPNYGNDNYAFQQIADAMSKYHLGRQEGTLIYTDSDITTIPVPHMFPEFTPYANVLLAHPQYQSISKRSRLSPYRETKDTAKEYFSNHKMAFDPSLVIFSVINGLISIYAVNTSTPIMGPMHKFFPCIPSIQSLEWVEQMPDDQMLRASINASEVGLKPVYISVWLQAQDANRKIEVLIMESTTICVHG